MARLDRRDKPKNKTSSPRRRQRAITNKTLYRLMWINLIMMGLANYDKFMQLHSQIASFLGY